VQGQAGPSWQDGADIGIPTYTVVRFLGRVQGERKFLLVTMAALFGGAGSFEYQRLPRSQGDAGGQCWFRLRNIVDNDILRFKRDGQAKLRRLIREVEKKRSGMPVTCSPNKPTGWLTSTIHPHSVHAASLMTGVSMISASQASTGATSLRPRKKPTRLAGRLPSRSGFVNWQKYQLTGEFLLATLTVIGPIEAEQ
jgi:hypothetical protein